jgi:hypothetical protein
MDGNVVVSSVLGSCCVGWRKKRMVGASALVESQPQTVGGRERSV